MAEVGVFNCLLRISTLDGEHSREVEAMVDTGSTYTLMPASLLRDMGISPTRRATFEFGDGRIAELDMARAWVTIDGASEVTPVVFGEEGASPLIGAVTLEELLLAVDPVGRKLVSTRAIR